MVRGDQTGHFFCATLGHRVYLRFVPLGATEDIIAELGTCLRLIECTEDTPSVVNTEMVDAALNAWQQARDNIYKAISASRCRILRISSFQCKA